MQEMNHRKKFRITARQAAEYLGVSMVTLRKMEKEGQHVLPRTPRGHRRYSLGMLEEYVESKRRSAAPRKTDGSN